MRKKSLYVSLGLLSFIFSCTNNVIPTKSTFKDTKRVVVNNSISGVALFPVRGFNIKATVADIGMNAAVSLIDPTNNTTLATGLTNSSGAFTINSGFGTTTGMTYVLEATRRIGGNASSSMSVRTFIKWNGTSWNSITTSGVSINSKTTALTSMVSLLGPSVVNPDDTIGIIVNGTLSDVSHNSSVVISAASITEVAELVAYSLTNHLDPVYYLKYSTGKNKFFLQDPQELPMIISTVAGGWIPTSDIGDGGLATLASINNPFGIATDSLGNIYIADTSNHRIRKVDTSGKISTIAGNGIANYSGDGGPATSASFRSPCGIAIDLSGNIYISDTENHRIRKIDTSGKISTIAGNGIANYSGDGGPATTASLHSPQAITIDPSGNIYIADFINNRIRKIDTSGNISTVAGGGTPSSGIGDGGLATAASLSSTAGIAIDLSGNIYIADTDNNRIRKVDTSGKISTIAGNGIANYSGDGGPATSASLKVPYRVATDSTGNIYIADSSNNRIRKVDTSGKISTIAGNGIANYSGDGGPSTSASLKNPFEVATDNLGNVYVADSRNNRIRKIDTSRNREVLPK